MKRSFIYIISLLVLALTCLACAEDVYYELPDGDKFDNLYIVQAVDNPVSFRMKTSFEGTITKSFSAYYSSMSAPKDIHMTFAVDPSLVETYNQETNSNYVLLPESAYSLKANSAVIKSGDCRTGLMDVDFQLSPDLELKVEYLLPIRMATKDVRVQDGLDVVYFTVGLTKDMTPVALEGKIADSDEIFSFNDNCILAHNNAAGTILRYPYDPASRVVGEPTEVMNPSIDPYWGASYARFILPGRGNTLHLTNIYGAWIALPCSEDGTTIGRVGAGEYTIITFGMGIILGCIPNMHSVGEMFIDMSTGGIRNYPLTDNGLGLTGQLGFATDFNYWPYVLRFCYKDDIYGVDSNGILWRHAYNASDFTFSSTPVRVGEGWAGKYTHIIPFGDDLIARKSDGSLLRFAFDPEDYWDVKDY